MEVLRMEQTDFTIDLAIDDYDSMIWTERYRTPGEFVLTTQDIAGTLNALPVDSLITLRDTYEVMIVENHEIKRDDDGVRVLEVTGRSWDCFLEQRTIVGDLEGFPKKGEWLMLKEYTAGSAAAVILWNHLVDNDPNVTGANDNTHSVTYVGDPQDLVDRVRITRTGTQDGTSRKRVLRPGYLHTTVLDFLDKDNLGIRTIRPHGQSADILSVQSDGTIDLTTNGNVTGKLILDVYKGKNRSFLQDDYPRVTFNVLAGHFDDATYLKSKKAYKTIAYVDTKFGTLQVPAPWLSGGLNDVERRVLYIQAEDKEDGVSEADYMDTQAEKAESALQKLRRRIWFDGQISPNAPHTYNDDYFLGDKVTLKGEFGIKNVMRVVEYVRTDDVEGDRGYPSLAYLDEE